jgi:hypothetical protein
MQDGCHFRHGVCRTRNLATLMGNANNCVFLARRSPDILGNVNIIWFGTRYRQYSRYYKSGRKISAETQGPCGRHTVCIAQDLPPRYRRQQLQRQLEEGYGELQTRSRLTSLGHAPAMGPHLACVSGSGRGRANLRVEVTAQPHQPYYAQTLASRANGRSARVELKCLCRRPVLVAIHMHPLVTLLLARNV